MELEFVRGVKLSESMASEARRIANELNVLLTAHAPYYINLMSNEESKVEASIRRIIESAEVGFKAGAWSVVFHPGYYGSLSGEECLVRVRNALKRIVNYLVDNGIKIWVRPETMGGLAEFGSLEEVVEVVSGLDYTLPCIDFAHLYARSRGEINSYDKFSKVLERVEKRLGSDALRNMHIHASGIEYGEKGEIRHLNLSESTFNYVDMVKAIKDFNVSGVIISESPNLEDDALLMLSTYINM